MPGSMDGEQRQRIGRRQFLIGAAAATATTLIAACSSAPSTSGGQTATGGAATPAATSAGSQSGAAPATVGKASAPSPTSMQDPAWQQVVDAGNKEGHVIVWAQVGAAYKAFLKDAFEKAYPKISVDLFQADSDSNRDARFLQDYKAGVAKVDIMVSGSAGVNARVKPTGALQSIRPYLLPQPLDPKSWLDNKILWVDHEQKYMLMSDTIVYPLTVNKSVDPAELQNWTDLLNPKWRAKIIMTDPRQSGAGFAFGLFMYNTPQLGKDFFDKFLQNQPVFSQDETTNLQWTDEGKMLINISATPATLKPLMAAGGTVKFIPTLKANGQTLEYYSGSIGIMFLPNLNPLPHPNATRVYANWFYSLAGQQAMVDVFGQPSHHAGVNMSKLPQYIIPKPGVNYENLNDEKYTATQSVTTMRKEVDAVYKAPQL